MGHLSRSGQPSEILRTNYAPIPMQPVKAPMARPGRNGFASDCIGLASKEVRTYSKAGTKEPNPKAHRESNFPSKTPSSSMTTTCPG
jgi:hypothetical protein